jgi:hypothetical protein
MATIKIGQGGKIMSREILDYEDCPTCGGEGAICDLFTGEDITCDTCNGYGRIER